MVGASVMGEVHSDWYKDGLRFECTRCGNCCTGPPGAVCFTASEGREIAEVLGLSEASFLKRYARKIRGKWSLREHKGPHGMDCVFLTRDAAGKAGCRIYAARPSQCRTWPFWPENLKSRQHWEAVKRETPCPGMGQGPLITVDSILKRLHGETDDCDGNT